jgi:hypothetical protein
MIMIGQSKRLAQPLRWTRAGRLAAILAVALLLAAGATAAVIGSTSGSHPRAGCIEVTFASTLGAALARQCGATARSTCAHPAQSPGLAAHGALREACRRAGLPYALR